MITPQSIEQLLASIISRVKKIEVRLGSNPIKTGLAAGRPATPDLTPNTTTTYYAYDSKVLSIWNIDSESWDEITFT